MKSNYRSLYFRGNEFYIRNIKKSLSIDYEIIKLGDIRLFYDIPEETPKNYKMPGVSTLNLKLNSKYEAKI